MAQASSSLLNRLVTLPNSASGVTSALSLPCLELEQLQASGSSGLKTHASPDLPGLKWSKVRYLEQEDATRSNRHRY